MILSEKVKYEVNLKEPQNIKDSLTEFHRCQNNELFYPPEVAATKHLKGPRTSRWRLVEKGWFRRLESFNNIQYNVRVNVIFITLQRKRVLIWLDTYIFSVCVSASAHLSLSLSLLPPSLWRETVNSLIVLSVRGQCVPCGTKGPSLAENYSGVPPFSRAADRVGAHTHTQLPHPQCCSGR